MRIAVFPGSFDPVTKGHEDLIYRASKMFDKVIVGVLVNSNKNSFLKAEDKKRILELALEDLPEVEVKVFDGLLVDFLRENNSKIIIRGLRSMLDLEYEMPLDYGNKVLDPQIETVYLLTKPEYSHISSSAVKELMKYNADISSYVSEKVLNALNELK
ncbi:MAG: pantetheine-phosphate adenylyltransferase [Lachnospiraceae bacterium]|nr:pantetheine-phosphate adenylyltransferase [Lachnospiraceae bacterium]